MKRSVQARAKRRTTLTLPADSLRQAERIARSRNVNLSTAVADVLDQGLRLHAATRRADEIMNAYRQAFAGFSDEEMMLLDGIIVKPVKR